MHRLLCGSQIIGAKNRFVNGFLTLLGGQYWNDVCNKDKKIIIDLIF
jgi:hypothetical protein